MLSIGELSAATGVKIPTIRYYEQIELLPKGDRDKGNRRRWSQGAIQRLLFIRAAREQGLTVEAIKDLLRVTALPAAQSAQTDSVVNIQLAAVRQKIDKLDQMKEVLTDAVDGVCCMTTTAQRLVQLAQEGVLPESKKVS
ncbi:MerR family transcriptional regulator [Mesorhizobium delmotii]|uniref:HTH merR-type domain-containing protein n=1 Tax=Mesorhizobium delmotii TaxID=1631247 RepID=A0A2P9ARE9_9HYPH|nr:MerR family transcriptional regulator [Mesorhizobium delmotii]SJM33732.1 hypothetical protein BQ8482_360133 [Mesorhizobium delmotii]